MAELILTQAEQDSIDWFELSDDTVGKLVKRMALQMQERDSLYGHSAAMGAALWLIYVADSKGDDAVTLIVDGQSDEGIQQWRVTAEKISENEDQPVTQRRVH